MQSQSNDQRERDLRIDFLRGLALLIIFSDHVVGNPIRDFMPISLGFSDLAEVFVFLTGCVCGMVYPLPLDWKQFWSVTRRLTIRALRVYLALMLMLGISWLLITSLNHFSGGSITSADLDCPPIDSQLIQFIVSALELSWLPRNFRVLALYLPFLLAVPLILVSLRWNATVTMAVSFAAYVAVQFFPEVISLPQPWRSAWLFNPMAWQLVFVFGIACGKRELGIVRWIPQGFWWVLVAAAWLEASFVYKMLWPTQAFPMAGKGILGAARGAHFFCVLIVGRVVLRKSFMWNSASRRPIILCGQHPLVAYCTGGICSSLGTLVFRTYGVELTSVAAVNLAGWVAIVAAAFVSQQWNPRLTVTGAAPIDVRAFQQTKEDGE